MGFSQFVSIDSTLLYCDIIKEWAACLCWCYQPCSDDAPAFYSIRCERWPLCLKSAYGCICGRKNDTSFLILFNVDSNILRCIRIPLGGGSGLIDCRLKDIIQRIMLWRTTLQHLHAVMRHTLLWRTILVVAIAHLSMLSCTASDLHAQRSQHACAHHTLSCKKIMISCSLNSLTWLLQKYRNP